MTSELCCLSRSVSLRQLCQLRTWASLATLTTVLLTACGGGGGAESLAEQSASVARTPLEQTDGGGGAAPTSQEVLPVVEADTTSRDAGATTRAATESTRVAIADLPKAGTLGVPDPGLLLLLIPDGLAVSDPGVGAWIDAASEIGVRLQPVTALGR